MCMENFNKETQSHECDSSVTDHMLSFVQRTHFSPLELRVFFRKLGKNEERIEDGVQDSLVVLAQTLHDVD